MNDIRRSILWVIFGFSMVLLWDKWQIHNGQPATFFTQPAPATAATAPKADGSLPTASAADGSAQLPGAANATAAKRELIDVQTDLFHVRFDTEGGSIVQAAFTKLLNNDKKPLVLLDDSAERRYMAQTGLIGGDFPNHKSAMRFSGERQMADGQNSLSVRFESDVVGGVKLVKTYTFKRGSYAIDVKNEVVNTGTAAVQPQLYMQLVRDGNKPEGESQFYSTFTGPAIYTEAAKYQKVDFEDIAKGKAEVAKQSDNGYVAMVQHYFASAWLLGQGVQRENFVRKVGDNLFAVGMITPLGEVAGGQSKSIENRLFIGPQQEKMLEALSPGLDLLKDYGWLAMLAKPLYWLLDKLHSFIQNWGWSIMALVLTIKLAFYWLNAKAYASMAKMKAINPKVTEMRERLKGDPQKMQQEMLRIYREEKVNPMGGCFPMLIQIPVFIALYWVLLSSVEMRHAPWVGWITDLSAPDPFYILPIVMTLTTVVQTALNPIPPDPMQAKMMWIMPLAFSVMFFFFPSGLVLYWITNNVLTIAQQWVINTRLGVPPQFNLPKFK
jgi:YidC/Oxa1 family membrane protein insertase